MRNQTAELYSHFLIPKKEPSWTRFLFSITNMFVDCYVGQFVVWTQHTTLLKMHAVLVRLI